MNRAHCVRNSTLCMFAYLLNSTQCRFQVSHIVHGIKNTENINTIKSRTFNKLFYYIISIMSVAQNILTSKQHLLWRIGHSLFNFTNTIPGVFTQKPNTGIKGCSTP